jgi:hypothetical protein
MDYTGLTDIVEKLDASAKHAHHICTPVHEDAQVIYPSRPPLDPL